MGPGQSDMDRKPSYEEDIGGFFIAIHMIFVAFIEKGKHFLSGEAKERCRCAWWDTFYSWDIFFVNMKKFKIKI